MNALMIAVLAILVVVQCGAFAEDREFERDRIETSAGNIEITFIGHGTLMLQFDGKTIQIDPWTRLADYGKLPKADLILLTHDHRDHLDLDAIKAASMENTVLVISQACAKKVDGGLVMKNGESKTLAGVKVGAVPAYNLVHMRESGEPYHPKGAGNGYVLTLGDKRVYIAGDTENVPEMKALKKIDVAFLPMNLPYTMTPEMVADAAKAFRPKILYPYHFGDTDPARLVELLSDEKDIEVRVRKMK